MAAANIIQPQHADEAIDMIVWVSIYISQIN